jgi:hypothetical protein
MLNSTRTLIGGFTSILMALAICVGFLACSSPTQPSQSSKVKKKNNEEPASIPQLNQADEINEILETHCLGCHSDDDQSGLGNILDIDNLMEKGVVKPGDPENSLLYKLVTSGEMPKNGSLTESNIELIYDWIKKGAIAKETDVERKFVPESAVYTNAASDLLDNFSSSERPNVRYFSLIHLYNGGLPDTEIQVNREALFKLLNSLSSASQVKKPEAIDNFNTLYRIELTDYGWSTKQWEDVIRSYPFMVIPAVAKSLGVLQEDTNTNVPLIKADWFVANASKAPLYYSMLGISADFKTFESKMGISLVNNVKSGNVIRAGFNDSLPSEQNRVIERHSVGSSSFLWRSYEFETSDGNQNIFDKPMGPQGTGHPNSFRDDGGEFIFSLNNGFFAFAIYGKDGNRLNIAPSKEGEEDIIAGQSCMSCHNNGLINKQDMVIKEAGSRGILDSQIEAIYVSHSKFKSQIDKDSDSYKDALNQANVNTKRKDPVFRVAKKYLLDVSTGQAAAEIGVQRSVLEGHLQRVQGLSSLFEGGSISRTNFEIKYKTLSTSLQTEIQ